MINTHWLQAMSYHSAPLKGLWDKYGEKLLSENGFNMTKETLGTTEMYRLIAVVSKERTIPLVYKDVAVETGLLEREDMEFGTSLIEMFAGDIVGGSAAEVGAKTGDTIEINDVALDEVDEYVSTINNYDFGATVTVNDRALKQAWIQRENGFDTLVGAMLAQVMRYKAQLDFGRVREGIGSIIDDTEHFPLQDTQKMTLTSWTDAAPTDEEITELIGFAKDVVEQLEEVVDVTSLNSAGITGSMSPEKLTLYVRKGLRKYVDKLLAYVYHDGKLSFPIKIKTLPDFGGCIYTDANGSKLQPVYVDKNTNYKGKLINKNGVIGYVDEKNGDTPIEVQGYAYKSGDNYVVDVKIGADTTTVTIKDAVGKFDPHADTVAVIAEEGIIREFVEQPLQHHVYPIYGTNFTQHKFFQVGNSMKSVAYKTFVQIKKPTA